ncbi:hypothetical protein E4T42_05064 [Aureobasidium subglaciale]|nr:hypothetical protein E4T42_05064 [Aureobasidium subglaciale]
MVQTRSDHAEESRHIISTTSAATGEIFYYERYYVYEEEAEVLYVEQRLNEHGKFVPYTSDKEEEEEEEEQDEEDNGSQDKSAMKLDRDYKGEDSAPGINEDDGYVAPEEKKRAPRRHKAVIKQPIGPPTKVGQENQVETRRKSARALEGGKEDKGDYDDSSYPAFEPNEGLERVPLLVTDLEAASLNCKRRKRSLLKNFRLADLSDISGLVAHTAEKEAYDLVRPGKVVSGRWVLMPRPTMFRPTNPEFQKYAGSEL